MADLAVEAGHLGGGQGEARAGARDDELVVRTLHAHAPALLRTARRWSLCADDAHDAYQRAVEIFVRRAGSLRRETVAQWLHTVVKHEAMAVRAQRSQLVGVEEADLEARVGDAVVEPQERVERFERTARAAEALAGLKPQEVTALWLKAEGLSYAEIAERQSWTYTKVNRCLAEGRKAFLARYAQIESGEECARWEPVLSRLVDGEAAGRDVRAARRHVRRCAACRATLRELHADGRAAAAVVPLVLGAVPVAGGAGGGASHAVLVKLHEAATALHERLVGAAAQVQTSVESASAAKVAAVAASAAAVAGGGAVAAHDAAPRSSHRPAVARVAPARPAAVPPTPSRVPLPPTALRRVARAAAPAPVSARPSSEPAEPRAAPAADALSVEATPAATAGASEAPREPAKRDAPPTAAPAGPAAPASEPAASGEFGVEGG